MFNKIKNYIKGAFEELPKVVWPTKNQAIKITIIVLIFCLVTAVFLAVVDYGFTEGYTQLIKLAGSLKAQ